MAKVDHLKIFFNFFFSNFIFYDIIFAIISLCLFLVFSFR